eukprot:6179242-Pleurochrysis_carterae.AAC.2
MHFLSSSPLQVVFFCKAERQQLSMLVRDRARTEVRSASCHSRLHDFRILTSVACLLQMH